MTYIVYWPLISCRQTKGTKVYRTESTGWGLKVRPPLRSPLIIKQPLNETYTIVSVAAATTA